MGSSPAVWQGGPSVAASPGVSGWGDKNAHMHMHVCVCSCEHCGGTCACVWAVSGYHCRAYGTHVCGMYVVCSVCLPVGVVCVHAFICAWCLGFAGVYAYVVYVWYVCAYMCSICGMCRYVCVCVCGVCLVCVCAYVHGVYGLFRCTK